MRERVTARVLLLDADGRLALMRFLSPGDPDRPFFWATIGGEVEPGEPLLEAASRETREETGVTPSSLGPVVWYGEVELTIGGEPVLFKESFVLARCERAGLSRAGWTDIERRAADDVRWWSVPEIVASRETIYPPDLARLLPALIAGRLPAEPLVIYAAPGRAITSEP